MKDNIIDFLFEGKESIIIDGSIIYRIDFEFFLKKNIPMSKLIWMGYAQENLRNFYKYNSVKFIELLSSYEDFCSENGIDFEYFVDMEYITMKEENNTENKKSVKGFIYVIKSGNFYKIGKTIDINSRLKKYITENPNEVKMIHWFETDDYSRKEKELHDMFKNKNHNREWFNLDKDDIKFIKSL